MIEFVNVTKKYKEKVVLDNLNLKIEKGGIIVLIGGSGCGKTTTLKMINKLIDPTSGEIYIDGKPISKENTIDLRRRIGYVIQNVGLLPHLTIRENIELIPKLKGMDKEKYSKKTLDLLNLVGLNPDEYLDKYPNQLSGGQQQRVGVARAFATEAEIILMDEPFSALDPITREALQEEIFNMQQQLNKTIIFVTHDMDEALKLASKICIMKDGHIVQYDTPENILRNPANDFIKEFVGANRIWSNPEYIKAKDIMINSPVSINTKRNVLQGIEIMKSKKVDSLIITDKEKRIEGIVTLKSIRKDMDRTRLLEEIMDKELIYVNEDDNVIDILKLIKEHSIGYVPVVNNFKQLVGLVTRSSLLSVIAEGLLDLDGGDN